MFDPEQELLRTCTHEVAHAYVAYKAGIADTFKIRIRGGIRGGASIQIDNIQQNPIAEISVLVAGEIAEKLFFGSAECCQGDREQLAACLEAIGWDADDERIGSIRRMVRNILKAGLREIASAAGKMSEPGTYTMRFGTGRRDGDRWARFRTRGVSEKAFAWVACEMPCSGESAFTVDFAD
jgi:hypothetical protein